MGEVGDGIFEKLSGIPDEEFRSKLDSLDEARFDEDEGRCCCHIRKPPDEPLFGLPIMDVELEVALLGMLFSRGRGSSELVEIRRVVAADCWPSLVAPPRLPNSLISSVGICFCFCWKRKVAENFIAGCIKCLAFNTFKSNSSNAQAC